ncbi:MAG: 16S rRNA (uracil(1498)-N(3))-methyltransferase [Candidatus Eisenbacteria bacterium]
MNLILLEETDFVDERTAHLTGPAYVHARQTLGIRVGDAIRVGRIGGLIGVGQVLRIRDDLAVLRVELEEEPPAKLPLTVILALPRPKRFRRILRTVAELGVAELIVMNAYRVEKSYWQTPLLRDERVREYLREGLEQARDTILPKVVKKRLFKPFVEDELSRLLVGRRGLVAHPGTAVAVPQVDDEPVTLVIGPEGGFLPYELAKLYETGLSPIDLGERILTVENALVVSVARLFR